VRTLAALPRALGARPTAAVAASRGASPGRRAAAFPALCVDVRASFRAPPHASLSRCPTTWSASGPRDVRVSRRAAARASSGAGDRLLVVLVNGLLGSPSNWDMLVDRVDLQGYLASDCGDDGDARRGGAR